MVQIIKCKCKHEFQDEVYGNGMRVFNERVAGGKNNGWRCSVCGNEVKV